MTRSILISLPVDSRKRAHDFYRTALGLEMVGEPTEDGMSEPLQFALGPKTLLMLIPTVGFEWVIGKDRLVSPGRNECLLTMTLPDESEVRAMFGKCIDAGATAISAPSQKDWGFEGIIADPDGHLWMLFAQA